MNISIAFILVNLIEPFTMAGFSVVHLQNNISIYCRSIVVLQLHVTGIRIENEQII